MDLDELVAQIAAKVKEKLSQMEVNAEIQPSCCEAKPKVLTLSEDYDTTGLQEHCEIEEFDVIVLRKVSNTALGKITEGIGDTAFTAAVIKAILLGKQIVAPNEELELFQYRDTAPKLYYGMMMQKLEMLKNVGVQFCSSDDLESVLLKKESLPEKKSTSVYQKEETVTTCNSPSEQTVNFTKRIITEQDMRGAFEKHATQICITKKTIITDLAREYAEHKGISFIIG